MDNEWKSTGNTTETITISGAEYEKLRSFKEQNAELSQQVQWLMEQMRLAKKRMFGASSEKAKAEAEEQLSLLFNEAEVYADIERHETVKVTEHVRKKTSGIQKDNLPEDVPTEVVSHDLPEDRRICPNCGTAMGKIGQEVRRTLVIVPAQVKVREDIYPVYACQNCEKSGIETPVVKTPKDKAVIPGSFASPDEYQPDRRADNPISFLKGFHGYLHTDGCQAYGKLENVTLVGCWAHARRKFDEAVKALPKSQQKTSSAGIELLYCSRLFEIKETIAELSPAERYAQRQSRAKPILDALLAWAKTRNAALKSALGQALHYLLGQWPRLIHYLDDGRLEISNNLAERSIKPFVMGRKNFLFANTPSGAKGSATMFSLIETARENALTLTGI